MSKHPNCHCSTKRFDYFRKRYKNGTLHLVRKCQNCGKVAQNAMKQAEYDLNWVDGLPVMENGILKHTVRSRADRIMAKLHEHIENRNTKQENLHATHP